MKLIQSLLYWKKRVLSSLWTIWFRHRPSPKYIIGVDFGSLEDYEAGIVVRCGCDDALKIEWWEGLEKLGEFRTEEELREQMLNEWRKARHETLL